jgi:hypothetical protein
MLHEHVPMDPGMIEAQTDLLNAISLQLWLIKMLQNGRVDDEQFIKMHREYEAQMDQLISQRKEMLEEAQNLDFIRDLNEVKIYYDELKKKRELGIISEEEYKVKARSFDWEINNLNEEIRRQEEKIEFLKDVSHGKHLEEVINTRTKAEDYKKALGSLKISGDVGQEVIIVTNESLDKILNYFKEFGEVNHEPEVSVPESIILQEEHLDVKKPEILMVDETKPEIQEIKVEEKIVDVKDIIIDVKEEKTVKSEVVRVMCPYHDKKGDKCKVLAFGRSEVDAYLKLENHVKKHHPEKMMDLKKTYARA